MIRQWMSITLCLCMVSIFFGCTPKKFGRSIELQMLPGLQEQVDYHEELQLQESIEERVNEDVVEQDSDIEEVESSLTLPLPSYEQLTYKLKWMGMTAGTITATIYDLIEYQGRKVYKMELHGESTNIISKIFRMDSKIISYLDAETLRPLKQEVDRKEGRYRKKAMTEFDHDEGVAKFYHVKNGTSNFYDIPSGILDSLGSVYYFRTLALDPGDRIEFDVVISEKIYEFKCEVAEKTFVDMKDFGRQEAVYVRPYGLLQGRKVNKGTLKGYFSTGPFKIPLKAVLQAPMFTKITATLVDVKYKKD